jgi:uncharacterized protein YdeI (YjbR/CyaY-like superfamily)
MFWLMSLDLPELTLTDVAAWRTWLGAHHGTSAGVWLVLAKKGTSVPTSLTYDEALDEALCHGWIDGQRKPRDADTYRQRFTQRRAASAWSQRNVVIAERLVGEGRVQTAGVRAIESAKADGRWAAAYPGQASIQIPPDLAAALREEPRARAMFNRLSSQNRYSVLYRIGAAKRADTRARRIENFVAMLAKGETIHPQKRA